MFKLVKLAIWQKIRQKCPWVSHFGFLCSRLLAIIPWHSFAASNSEGTNYFFSRSFSVLFRGGRYIIERREKWPEKVGRREKLGRKCREQGENEMLGVVRLQ